MAELADALDSGSNGRKAVQVQVLLSAPKKDNPKGLSFFMRQRTWNKTTFCRQTTLRLFAPARCAAGATLCK